MGVVNVTPDSFSDGGNFFNKNKAIEHGLSLIEAGADILDIGGESTRPGAEVVDIEEEISRVVPVIEGLKGKTSWISIDTRNAKTMEKAIHAGANIINDISGLDYDPLSIGVVGESQLPVILMHMQGDPRTMQKNPSYNNVINDIRDYLQRRIDECLANRIEIQNIAIDPGVGFGKSLEDNLLIIRNIKEFCDLDVPVLLGTSRKSFIGRVSGAENPANRLGGSLASALWGVSQGVRILRVHDVQETVQAIEIYQAISEVGSDSRHTDFRITVSEKS